MLIIFFDKIKETFFESQILSIFLVSFEVKHPFDHSSKQTILIVEDTLNNAN